MKASVIGKAIIGSAWLAYVCVLIWPTAAFLGTLALEAQTSDEMTSSFSRWLSLIGKSGWMALAATLATLVLAIPAAMIIARSNRAMSRPVFTTALFSIVLAPPMVYAFGWQRLISGLGGSSLACVAIWSLWAWPMAAVLLGWGWAHVSQSSFEVALLQTSRVRAFLHVGLPAMRHYVAMVACCCFVFFFNEYSVPHACGLIVYATELLGWATSTNGAAAVVWPALPSMGITLLAVCATLWLAVRWPGEKTEHHDTDISLTSCGGAKALMLILLCMSIVIPVGALCVKLLSRAAMVEAWLTYDHDLLMSLMVAGTAGFVSVLMGWGVANATQPGAMSYAIRGVFALSLLFGAAPGALVGETFIAAYNSGPLSLVYDHWPIVMLGNVARFSWIAMLGGYLLARLADRDLRAQAGTDGADGLTLLAHLMVMMYWPIWLALGAVVAALSMAELPTTALLRVPGFTPIAHLIVEKFHRFEDGMLVSLSVWLMLSSLCAAAVIALASMSVGRHR